MPHWTETLSQKLENPFATPVYYFTSAGEAMVREAALLTRTALLAGEQGGDYTRLDGPVPDFGSLIEAAGTISFFGTPRVVELREITPGAFSDKDIDELCGLFALLENAVLLITAVYADPKAAAGKRAQKLFKAAGQQGLALDIALPTARENQSFIKAAAVGLGASVSDEAARALLERAGGDRPMLLNEVEKLAAMCAYGEITLPLVEKYAVTNIETQVFELARYITGRRKAGAYALLGQLLAQREEPLAITGALAGAFVDMYRVACAAKQRIPVATVFKEMGYKGNPYRLEKAKESAARYTPAQLERSLLCLADLDKALKSSALPDKGVLLEAALGNLLQIGGER